jgi:hypothetical protein
MAGVAVSGGSSFISFVGSVFGYLTGGSPGESGAGLFAEGGQEKFINGNNTGPARPKVNRYPGSFQRRAGVAKFAAIGTAPLAAEYGAKCVTNIYNWYNN